MNTKTREIWFTTTANGNKRAWYFNRMAFRAMPVKMAVAELELATGAATLCTRPEWIGK